MLDKPSSDVTLISRCLSTTEYTSCKFFRESQISPSLIHEQIGREYGRPILMIHGLTKPEKSECQFFKLVSHESGNYLAACDVLRRYLSIYEVRLCAQLWADCPYRRQAEQ
ncbi:MAG: hypothetical protein QXO98_01400 [Sulfolobales archaeon]